MAFTLAKSIYPMSELRSDPEKIKKQLKLSPVLITNKGKPDFGLCDLETLEIVIKISNLREKIEGRRQSAQPATDAKSVLDRLEKKYALQ